MELASVSYDDSESAYATLPSSLMPAKYRLLANGKADLAGNALEETAPDRHFYGPGELRGQFWYDRNHNTLNDSDEEVLRDWTVYLDSNNNGERDPGEPNATTDQAGNYAFTGLLPGGYTGAEKIPYGWVQTYPREQSLGSEETFTSVGWLYERESPGFGFATRITSDSLGNAWYAGIVPEGNFTLGTQRFDGNGTSGELFLAKVTPTGQIGQVNTFGKPDSNGTGLDPNLRVKADSDGGVWLSGAYDGTLQIGSRNTRCQRLRLHFSCSFPIRNSNPPTSIPFPILASPLCLRTRMGGSASPEPLPDRSHLAEPCLMQMAAKMASSPALPPPAPFLGQAWVEKPTKPPNPLSSTPRAGFGFPRIPTPPISQPDPTRWTCPETPVATLPCMMPTATTSGPSIRLGT